MSKRVALINPGKEERFDVHEPLNIGYIASFLEQNGVDTRIFDELAGDAVEDNILTFKPDIVGITATTPFASIAYRHATYCRNLGIPTVIGGVHASVATQDVLKYADMVVKGEGEMPMLDIVLNGIRDKIICRPHIKSLDSFPPPAYHLMNMEYYIASRDRSPYDSALIFVPKHTKVASMLTSRGCPHSCIFCHNSWKELPFRSLSPERVIADMKLLIDMYGIGSIIFYDDDFFAIRKRAQRICELIIENRLNLIWGCNGRADTVDKATLEIAKAAGCRQVAFGIESGSQKILDILNKKTTVQQNENAIRMCKEVEIMSAAYFILGSPHETKLDLKLTREFILRNDIDCIGICIATPFPGTKLWDWCVEQDFVPQDPDWSLFSPDNSPFQVSQYITPDFIRQYRSRIFLSFALKKNSLRKFLGIIVDNPSESVKKACKLFRHLI